MRPCHPRKVGPVLHVQNRWRISSGELASDADAECSGISKRISGFVAAGAADRGIFGKNFSENNFLPSAALVLIGWVLGENEAANNRRKEKIPDESNQVSCCQIYDGQLKNPRWIQVSVCTFKKEITMANQDTFIKTIGTDTHLKEKW